MPEVPIGGLVRLYRIQRRMSTVSLVTRAGITVRYLEMIKADSKTPSVPVLRKLAKVLGVRTSALVGEPPSEDYEGPVNPRLAEVERALCTYRSLALTDPRQLPSLEELGEQISAAKQAWYTSPSKYSDALRVLPDLIVHSERAVYEYNRSVQACRQISELYQLARTVVNHLGRVDLGAVVADRAMRYAEETEDPLLIAAATWSLGHALRSDDMPAQSLEVAVKGREALEPLLPDGSPELFSLYGGLLLVEVMGSLRTGDPWRARELLREPAHQAALRVGEGPNYHQMMFGPTNVGIHMVAVEYECGEFSEALRLADDVDISQIPSLERKTAHLYQVARCYGCRNNDAAVFVHLKMAEQLCPQGFQHNQVVRSMVSTLVKRAKPSYAPDVRAFAARIGLLD
ncbi:MAG: helix-turn-helix transcriptional regulator [Pseudonocardiales bacterium]|nr:helix-turn-helix transcriptional regulator [Pseudonocardiales bacterium]